MISKCDTAGEIILSVMLNIHFGDLDPDLARVWACGSRKNGYVLRLIERVGRTARFRDRQRSICRSTLEWISLRMM